MGERADTTYLWIVPYPRVSFHFYLRLFLKTEIVAKQFSFYISVNSDTFMLSRPLKPEAMCCVARCYATLMTTIISFSTDRFNETKGVNNKKRPRLYISCAMFLFPQPFMIIAVLTLVNRSDYRWSVQYWC